MKMREVSKDEFFNTVGQLDVHPRPVGRYPYTSEWEMRHTRELKGRTVNSLPPGKGWPVTTTYFVVEN